jgi:histidinol phosphatase-like enzyme
MIFYNLKQCRGYAENNMKKFFKTFDGTFHSFLQYRHHQACKNNSRSPHAIV